MKIDHLNVVSAKMRPRLGWGNSPGIELVSSEPLISQDEIYQYNDVEKVYWCQLPDGFTSFYYAGPLSLVDGKFRTKNAGGYGGREFPVKFLMEGAVVDVILHGPWSGGCYAANKILPKPACEVSVNNCHGINLTLEAIRRIIREFGLTDWNITLTNKLSDKRTTPEFTYKGLIKSEWTDEIKAELKSANLDEYNQRAKDYLRL